MKRLINITFLICLLASIFIACNNRKTTCNDFGAKPEYKFDTLKVKLTFIDSNDSCLIICRTLNDSIKEYFLNFDSTNQEKFYSYFKEQTRDSDAPFKIYCVLDTNISDDGMISENNILGFSLFNFKFGGLCQFHRFYYRDGDKYIENKKFSSETYMCSRDDLEYVWENEPYNTKSGKKYSEVLCLWNSQVKIIDNMNAHYNYLNYLVRELRSK